MGIGSTIIKQSEMKSDTANAKNSSSVLTHLVIRLIAEVQKAANSPLQENMKARQNPPVQILTSAITKMYMALEKSRRLVLSTTKMRR